ncbi:hypothetical protein PTKIN_Ptkin11bG0196300 [Pterospermum kingtungense]
MKVGAKIGRPIRFDQATDLVSRRKFARLCVEVDITKQLLSKFKLHRRVRRIEYEGIHLVCFSCGVYGHRKETCPSLKEDLVVGAEDKEPDQGGVHPKSRKGEVGHIREQLGESVNAEVLETFGPWMLVNRKSRRGGGKRDGCTRNKVTKIGKHVVHDSTLSRGLRMGNSRFAALETLD